jgi:hypothetical protein
MLGRSSLYACRGREASRREVHEEELTILDRTPVTEAINRLISAGTTEQALLATVAQLFPNLTPAEPSQALQVATATAGRRIVKARH